MSAAHLTPPDNFAGISECSRQTYIFTRGRRPFYRGQALPFGPRRSRASESPCGLPKGSWGEKVFYSEGPSWENLVHNPFACWARITLKEDPHWAAQQGSFISRI